MTPPTRPLGRNGPPVTAIGFGAMSLGGIYGPGGTTEDKLAVLDRAWAIGERFWDTAEGYFESEAVIGEWFKRSGKRDDIFLATKFAVHYSDWTTYRGDPEYVRLACDRSLKTMGVDTIDLYYYHRVDGKTPIETTVAAMAELKKEGKIRHLGLSEVSAATIRRAHTVHPISAVQIEYSLFCLDIEDPAIDVLRTCRELGIAVVAYSPVGRGLLTGQVRSFDDLPENDFRRAVPKFSRENFPKVLELVAKVEAVAERRGCTTAQACLAWLLAQGEDIIPIPGTKTIKYLDENTEAAEVVLTEEDVAELRRAAVEVEIPGARYPPGMADSLFADTPEL